MMFQSWWSEIIYDQMKDDKNANPKKNPKKQTKKSSLFSTFSGFQHFKKFKTKEKEKNIFVVTLS